MKRALLAVVLAALVGFSSTLATAQDSVSDAAAARGGTHAETASSRLPTIYFSEDCRDNDRGWTLGPEWGIGSASASVGHDAGNPDPAIDGTPTSTTGSPA
jgi:hypothetical protein